MLSTSSAGPNSIATLRNANRLATKMRAAQPR